MLRLRVHFFCLALALFDLAALHATDPIKVGIYSSLTGKEANWGQAYEKGARLAVDELNAVGGVLGRPIQLLVEDNQSKAGESTTAVRKLISRDKVIAILGEVASSRSLEGAPICQQYKIPMISSGSSPKVTEMGTYIFRATYIDPFQGTVMARFAIKNLGAHRVALLVDLTNAYSVGLANFFKERFTADGGQVVLSQKYSSGERDFKAQLTAIRAAHVDAIFAPAFYTEAGLIVAQARQIGFDGAILGGDAWAAPQLEEIAGAALTGTYYCDNFSIDSDLPATQEFLRRYRARYHEEPDSVAPIAYDAVGMLVDALKRAGTTDSVKLRDALATIKDLPGVSGTITVDAKRNPVKPAYIVGYRDGRWRFIEAVNP